jgi:hypothetical protein
MVGDARSISGNQGKNEYRLQLVAAKRKPRVRGFSFESDWAFPVLLLSNAKPWQGSTSMAGRSFLGWIRSVLIAPGRHNCHTLKRRRGFL